MRRKENCVEKLVITRVVSKVSFPIFFLSILWTDQLEIVEGYNFWVSSNTVKITWQSLRKNLQNTVLKMELPLRVVAPCEVRVGIRFLPPKTNQLLKFIEKYVRAVAISLLQKNSVTTAKLSILTYLHGKPRNFYIYSIKERQNVSNTSTHQEVVVTLFTLSCYSHFSCLENFKGSFWKIMILQL